MPRYLDLRDALGAPEHRADGPARTVHAAVARERQAVKITAEQLHQLIADEVSTGTIDALPLADGRVEAWVDGTLDFTKLAAEINKLVEARD